MSSGNHTVVKVGVDMSLALEAVHHVKCAFRQMQDVPRHKARLDALLTVPIMTHTLTAVQCRQAVQYADTVVQILTNLLKGWVCFTVLSFLYLLSSQHVKLKAACAGDFSMQ